ncbi:MAG: endo-1,4-beta-xylanase, partial [Oscillospiraceae bacterium]|nr:endo-1,4-beta-xylanase [Oscillospiraceae bacterium]
ELSSGADFIKKHFNSITPENELKPDSLLQQQASIQGGDNTHAVVSLSSAAQTLKFCEDNNIGVRGHTFVWYSQTPDWFFREGFQSNGNYVSADIMNKRLENFIKDTFDLLKKEYPNLNVYAYDVCNELFLNDGGGLRPGGSASSGGSNWTRIYSDDSFIINAFTYARKYAPAGCKLYINDYNEYIPAKTNDIYNIAMKLKQKGVIDGIGMQSHLDVGYPNASTYKTALEKFLSTGLEVSITELDITTSNNFTAQASLFKQIFEMAVENRDQIPSFTVWGTHDPISWRSSQNPLLFGNNYTEKEAYKQVMSINVPSGGSNNDNNNNGDTNIPVVTTTVLNPGTSVKFGDINGDGDIDLSDLTLISIYLLGDKDLTADQKLAANVSYDSSVDVADLALLKQYISKDNVELGKGYTGNTGNSQGNSNTNQGSNTGSNGSVNGSAPTGSGTGISDGFEGSGTTWAARGEDVSILLTNSLKRSGSKSLAVTGRTASWNGISASSSDLAAGGSYSFDSYVTYNNNTYSTAGFEFGVQYDLGGETQYENVGSATTSSGKWAELSGDFSVPAGATNVSLYIQSAYTESDTAADMIDFFVDDIQFTKTGSDTGGNTTTNPSSGTMVGSVSNGTWSSTCDTSWIDPSKPMVAFTFDDGPVGTASNATSIRIQNALTKNGYHATFFYWGQKINGSNSAEIKRAFDAGFEIGNHTYSHPYLTNLSASGVQSEINQTKTILNGIVGNGDFLVRPPYLSVNGTVQSAAGVPLINCGIDTEDWNNASKDAIVNKLKSAMQNGSLNKQIVLMHETYETTAAAMEELLPYMKSQGWQVVSVSELFKASGKQLKAGTAYTSAK